MSYAKSAVVCRAALALAPLQMKINLHGGCSWAFGRRAFSAGVVAWLIAKGEAIREGNTVRAV
jgi:hypothetical protein